MTRKTSKKDRKISRNIDREFMVDKKRQIYLERKYKMTYRKCSVCGKLLEEWESDPCEECMNDEASFVNNPNIWPNEEDF